MSGSDRSSQANGRGVSPHSRDAEVACLGAILLDNDAFEVVNGIVQKSSFFIEGHQCIYGAMAQLRAEKVPIDHVTLAERLSANGHMDKVGGVMILAGLTDSVATAANAEHYANIVREKHGIRQVVYKSQELVSRALGGADPAEILESVERVGLASRGVARSTMPTSVFSLGHTVMETYAKVEAGFSGIALPWETVNRMTMGMWPGTITFFVARPGVGKCQKFDTPICCARTGRYKTIQQVVRDRCDVFSRGVDGQIFPVTPDAWLHTGRKECLKVRLHSGREMSQTPEHPFMTVDGWKRTDELAAGDYVEVAGAVPQPLDAISVTEHEAVLLGGMLADGSLHSCGFTKSDDEIVSVMRRAVEYFGGELVHRDGEPSCQYYAIRRGGRGGRGPNPIREVLNGLGCKMTLSKEKEIPDRVFQYDNDSLAIFLGMIWGCDGSFPVSKGGHVTAEIGLASRVMVEQLQRLFLRFGVHGRVRHKPVNLNGEVFDSWVYKVYATSLGRFRDVIPIVGGKAEKAALLRDPANPNVDNVPMTDLLAARLKVFVASFSAAERSRRFRAMGAALGMTTPFSVSHLYRRKTVSRRTFAAFVDAFEYEDGRPLLRNHWDRVEEVSDDGEQEVYDLTVDGTHSFVANDIVVHNTMVAIIAARHAWLNDERVLIISPEMSKEEIAERFFVIHAGVNYDNVVRGTLSAFEKPKLVKTVDEALKLNGMWIMDSDDDLSPRGIDAAIRACNPSLIAIDALYDIHVRGDRRERLLTALDWLRKTTKHFGIPSVAFAQLNRDAELSEKKGGGIRLGTIALADEIAQDTHAIHALEQTKDMRADKWMRIRTLKIRRGRIFKDATEVNWNFETMDFSERSQREEEYEDDQIPF